MHCTHSERIVRSYKLKDQTHSPRTPGFEIFWGPSGQMLGFGLGLSQDPRGSFQK